VAAALTAAEKGAEIVFMPEPLSLYAADGAVERFHKGLEGLGATHLIPSVGADVSGFAATAPEIDGIEAAGRIALLVGDACITGGELVRILGDGPAIAVLAPRSESELQAEAVLELAIALSESLAGLIVVTECAGAQPGEPGHGGSVIVHLGKVLAEAVDDGDDVLIADIGLPVPQPEPREALPVIPPLLAQRLAHHRGEKLQVDYFADLS
jgi:hypothetical protein